MPVHCVNLKGIELQPGHSLLVKMGPRKNFTVLISYSADRKRCFISAPFTDQQKVVEVTASGLKKSSRAERARLLGH
jgi:hypothetical protein